MEKSTFYITLDVHTPVSQHTLEVMHRDTARRVVCSLVEDGKPFFVPDGCVAMMWQERSDSTKISVPCDFSAGNVIFDFTADVSAVPGLSRCELNVYGGDGDIITSPVFEIVVNGTVHQPDDVPADSEPLAALDALVDELTGLKISLEESAENGDFNGAPGKDGESVTVESVSESTADGGTNVVTFSDGNTLSVKNGRAGSAGADGKDGESVFVEFITEATGSGGYNVVTFSDGSTLRVKNGVDGVDGLPGTDGKDGADGESVEIESYTESAADGGTNIVVFSDGNELRVRNGRRGTAGADGADGKDGADGTSVTITNISESSVDGGANIVVFSDGKVLRVKNGKTGAAGVSGVYMGSDTPPDDADFWIDPSGGTTTVDELVAAVIAALPVYNGEVTEA